MSFLGHTLVNHLKCALVAALAAAVVFTPAVLPRSVAGASVASAETPGFPADPTRLVNTSIGNNGAGTTFPGAALPFGMVQNSPDTQLGKYASYDYSQQSILGFSQIHLSGVGCETAGLVRLMPTTGAVESGLETAYGSLFSHETEVASPGRYQVDLDTYGVRAELSATERTGQHRYTYPITAAQQNVLVEVGRGNGHTFASQVKVVGDDTIEGWVRGGNFCHETRTDRYDVFFSLKFDRPFTTFGTWDLTGAPVPARREVAQTGLTANNQRLGAFASFSGLDARQVRASVGISYVSVEGARLNRITESERDGRMIGFDELSDRAHDVWVEALNRLRVAGGSYADQRTFYSAVYRSLLHPSVGSDVNGAYRGLDNQVHTADHPYYQMFSLWDTYRSQNQLVALLYPARAADMTRSILRIYQDAGWVPRWTLGNSETNVMSGDPITPWVVTNWSRGILDDATSRALFDALWRNANEVPANQRPIRGRDGNPTYVKNGWIGYSPYVWGDTRQAGSATLEYALGDCMLARMARSLGEDAKATALGARCDNISNIWDATATSMGFTGFPRARTETGAWVGSADPTDSTAFQEGTAWQYQWLAQQDPKALYALMGGAAAAEARLDTFFDFPNVLANPDTVARESWVVGAYDYHHNYAFNPNNEPDLHAPWMYAWTGSPWKTSAVLRAARPLFTDDPYGMPGNDDLGTISAWLASSMIGLFEVQPGSANWVLSAPMFPRVQITPEGGAPITIVTDGASASSLQYIKSVQVTKGRKTTPWTKSWISDRDLKGATITIKLTEDPTATTWGTALRDQPPTFG